MREVLSEITQTYPVPTTNKRRIRRAACAAGLAGASLILASCGSTEAAPGPVVPSGAPSSTIAESASPSPTLSPSPSATETQHTTGNVAVTFTDLDGSYNTIKVYKGPGKSEYDRESSGTYDDGASVAASCKTTGRDISSHPELGEKEDVTDNRWVRLDTNGKDPQYATLTYLENRDEIWDEISVEC